MQEITVTINGIIHRRSIDPRMLLLDFIRDEIGLTGSKRGCNEGKCGACVVIVNGMTVKSCNLLALQAHGKEILTVEGLSQDGNLHPIAEAFHEKHSVQCGFCTAGFLLTAKWIIDNISDLTSAKVRDLIHGNICRCTGYQKIVEGILEAVHRLADQKGAAKST